MKKRDFSLSNGDENKKKQPEVVIMGGKKSEGVALGVCFIFSGIILILNTFSIVPWEIWNAVFRFWPVLIILAGFQMILGEGKISRFILTLITIALFGWVVLISLNEVSPEIVKKLPEIFQRPLEWWEVISQ